MEPRRTLTVAVLALALSIAPVVGLAAADEEDRVEVHAEPVLPEPGDEAVDAQAQQPYAHYDCVGPGPTPAAAAPHSGHTETVSGFAFGGDRVQFQVLGLHPFTSGTCPVAGDTGPVLGHDFTGQYRVTAVCADGTSNPGTVNLDWQLDLVAGLPLAQASVGAPCVGSPGDSFSLDVTVSMSETDVLFGVPVDPVGGIELTVSQ